MTASEDTGYARFTTNVLTRDDVDPVTNCIGAPYINKDGLTAQNLGLDTCDRYMGKRCADKWDNYCEAYLAQGNVDSGGFMHLNRSFLEAAAKAKYCRAAVDQPGSQCTLRCEPFNPQAAASAQLCDWVGTQNWMNTESEADLAGNFPQNAILNPLSPVFMDRCPFVCDGAMLKEITADDAVMNKCIDTGSCGETLTSLAYYVVKNNIPVSNPKFAKFVELAKIDRPFNPNIVARIAKNYSLPYQQALDILSTPPDGVPQNLYPTAPGNNVKDKMKEDTKVSNSKKQKDTNSKRKKEGYTKSTLKSSLFTPQNCLLASLILILLIIIIVLILFYRKN